MLLCGMNFINLIRIRSIFGIEDQLILSYNPEMYKNICWSSSARDHRDFQHEKRYDTNFNVISSASGKGLLPSAAALACAFHDFLENRMEFVNGLAVFFGNGHMAQSRFIALFAFFIFGNRVMAVAF